LGVVSATAGAAGNVDLDAVVAVLRRAGARFAYLHGSVVSGRARPGSDVDVAAGFGRDADTLAVAASLPGRADLLVLDRAPLELAGRVALHGRLLFDDDPPARVAWEATTRKVYLDERPRIERSRAEFARAWRRG
jgi:predicted nucleotidyltransferase